MGSGKRARVGRVQHHCGVYARPRSMILPPVTLAHGVPSEPHAVIRVAGDVDMRDADRLLGAVTQAIAGGATHIGIELSLVTFIDCSGLGELVAARNVCAAGDVDMELVAPSAIVRRLLSLTELESALRVSADSAGSDQRTARTHRRGRGAESG